VEVVPVFLKTGEDKKKRNRRSLEIVRQILSFALVKVRKTRIMYSASLNYVQLNRYLRGLLESGLLRYDGVSHYVTTEDGKRFLESYADYVSRLSRIERETEETAKQKRTLEDMCFKNCDAKEKAVGEENECEKDAC
jgi:predicted transcriptional regulator